MEVIKNPKVEEIYSSYPKNVQEKLRALRTLILETADEIEDLKTLEETLKWGEPSYTTKNGSSIRLNKKKSNPDQFAMYFICSTSLVATFRILYRDTFTFEDNRAIVFHVSDDIPTTSLKHCITLALTYHKIKHLPLLGA